MSAARKGKGPSTKDKVVSSALAVGAMAGIAGLLAFQTAQVASASPSIDNAVSGSSSSAGAAQGTQASYDAQVAAYKAKVGKGSKAYAGSQRSASKPTVSAPQRSSNAPQATTKGS
jgi:hypothetical protein